MPVDLKVEILSDSTDKSGVFSKIRLMPTTRWKSLELSEIMDLGMAGLALVTADDESDFLDGFQWKLQVDDDFYVGILEVNPGERGVE